MLHGMSNWTVYASSPVQFDGFYAVILASRDTPRECLTRSSPFVVYTSWFSARVRGADEARLDV